MHCRTKWLESSADTAFASSEAFHGPLGAYLRNLSLDDYAAADVDALPSLRRTSSASADTDSEQRSAEDLPLADLLARAQALTTTPEGLPVASPCSPFSTVCVLLCLTSSQPYAGQSRK